MNAWRIAGQKILAAAAAMTLLLASAGDLRALEIEAVVWGFDGKVVPNEFNPMSVLVFNPTADNFDGQLQLAKFWGGDIKRKGAALIEPVFVSPFTKKWVQFYPFIQREQEEWAITWEPGRGRERIRHTPIHGTKAHVLMDSAGSLSRGGSLRMFDEDLFPPYVAATAGLASVTLDHQPRHWQKSQQQAFLDWIYAGGDVHILHNEEGKFPKFEKALSVLNTPVEKVRLGAGTVHRYPRTRNKLSRKFAAQQILHLPEQPAETEEPAEDEAAAEAEVAYDYSNKMMFSEVNQNLLRELKGVTRPKHNWILIHFMSVFYILLVFPGCWLVGRKWKDYRLALGALLGTVVLFGLGFHEVGSQSYSDAATVNTLAIVRPLSNGTMMVNSWSNVFGTGRRRDKVALGNSGEIYDIVEHAGSGRLYSTAHENESVSGFIVNGIEGRCLFDIPPFSSRETINAYKTELKPIEVKATKWAVNGEDVEIELSTGPTFPVAAETIYALHGRRFYSVIRNGKRLTVGSSLGEVSSFLEHNTMQNMNNFGPFGGRDERKPAEVFSSTLVPLLARQLGINSDKDLETFSLPPGRIRLFVFTELPKELYLNNPAFKKQDGRVLYCFDIFNPEEL